MISLSYIVQEFVIMFSLLKTLLKMTNPEVIRKV